MALARGRSGSKRKGGQGGRRRAPARSGSSLWPWMAALVAVAGGIALYDNFAPAKRLVASLTAEKPVRTATREEPREKSVAAKPQQSQAHRAPTPVPPRPVGPPDRTQTAAISPPAPIGKPELEVASLSAAAPKRGETLAGAYQGKFFLCGTAKQDDCVVTADRFVFHGQKIRLVGIEVPDIKKPRCEAERIKASDAKLRVRAFLDSGPFDLVTWNGNDAVIDGHQLRDVTRNGRSLADVLVSEGLAKRPGASTSGWCG
jgi:endonuclease YncB( thermonuclease family)